MPPTRPCLNYHIGLCKGPCAGFIGRKEYNAIVSEMIDLLMGKDKTIVNRLKKEMEVAAEALEFEKAAGLRDKIAAIDKITERQKIITGTFQDEDYISVFSDEMHSCGQIFFLRDGKIVGREHFILENTAGASKGEIVADFLKRFYGGTAFIPKNIFVSEIEEQELLEQWLSMKRGTKVSIKEPQKGEKKDLIDMVENNAKVTLEQFKEKIIQEKEINEVAIKNLAEAIGLEEIPNRIEAYDISNIQGVDSVGSMIVFEKGKAKNSDYRRFKIKSVKGANDYDSMREILTRRFQHGLEEVKAIRDNNMFLSAGKFSIFPDLILMDGGKGQVNVALEVLKSFSIDIPVCGMVKDDKHNSRGLVYNNKELYMRPSSSEMHLVTRIQDEVHRFAITYHRSLRDKRTLHSVLEEIPNIGERRRKALLMKFKSVENIKNAKLEELIDTPSMDKKSGASLYDYFHKEDGKK
jgi:excinuclease ABC subunit C